MAEGLGKYIQKISLKCFIPQHTHSHAIEHKFQPYFYRFKKERYSRNKTILMQTSEFQVRFLSILSDIIFNTSIIYNPYQ